MGSEVGHKADFSLIRYAQVWEDADVLLEALGVQPGQTVLSIASAGDNALALLTKGPKRVIALDLSPAQLACLELRVAGYRELSHPELLELVGSRPSARRVGLYRRCRPLLSKDFQKFWDAKAVEMERGIGAIGKFERYFELFRRRALPLVHTHRRIDRLLSGGTLEERRAFYENHWNNRRWRWMFNVFFSRFVMGRLGRDPSFFQYVEGSVADRILQRAHHALTELNPAENPYMQWILTGAHTTALPLALRAEHFDRIRSNLDRLEWHCCPIEDFLQGQSRSVDHFNLSDIFEYMSTENYQQLLEKIVAAGRPGGRLAYWNMLAPRRRPEALADRLRPLEELSKRLHQQDKAFFYSAFVVEEIL
ncbi:MAG TPA: BtaA family protein [Candidatus Bipolaricaulota bacterium]